MGANCKKIIDGLNEMKRVCIERKSCIDCEIFDICMEVDKATKHEVCKPERFNFKECDC